MDFVSTTTKETVLLYGESFRFYQWMVNHEIVHLNSCYTNHKLGCIVDWRRSMAVHPDRQLVLILRPNHVYPSWWLMSSNNSLMQSEKRSVEYTGIQVPQNYKSILCGKVLLKNYFTILLSSLACTKRMFKCYFMVYGWCYQSK